MIQEFVFDDHHAMLKKYEELLAKGVDRKNITLISPHPVHGLDAKVEPKPSRVKLFTLLGGLTGVTFGLCFQLYTVFSWPIVVGGKPLFAVVPFIIISFELLILLGGLCSMLGFLILARFPSIQGMLSSQDYGNRFAILVEKKDS